MNTIQLATLNGFLWGCIFAWIICSCKSEGKNEK